MDHTANTILGVINSPNLTVGEGVYVGAGASITATRVILGDHCFVGPGVIIDVGEFRLGDYSKIQAGTVGFGSESLRIGRNCWIGGRCDLDSQGGLDIDDNVGIGSMSQVWTHIRHGDTVQGCRFESKRYMRVGRDAWFVGSCLVSPTDVGERSMAMLGSVVTSPMLPDRTYAGVPARDITDKIGPQFEVITIDEKRRRLVAFITTFEHEYPEHAGSLLVADDADEVCLDDELTYFLIAERTYTKKRTAAEARFFKTNGLAKFAPLGEVSFID